MQEEDDLEASFNRYDLNKDGVIDSEEAIQLLVDAGAQPDLKLAREIVDSMDVSNTGTVSLDEFKQAVDRAAEPISKRIYPITGTLLLNFLGQGIMVPILPILARSAGLSVSELGVVASATSIARLCMNVPASMFAERFGRRPLLVCVMCHVIHCSAASQRRSRKWSSS